MAIVTVPKPLREKLGEEGAEALITLLNQANGQVKEDVIEVVAERFEKRLAEEIGKLRGEMGQMEGRLRGEMGQMEGRLIRWSFLFWVGQVATIVAILFAFFK